MNRKITMNVLGTTMKVPIGYSVIFFQQTFNYYFFI